MGEIGGMRVGAGAEIIFTEDGKIQNQRYAACAVCRR